MAKPAKKIGRPRWKPPSKQKQAEMEAKIRKGRGLHTTLESYDVDPVTFQRYDNVRKGKSEGPITDRQTEFCSALRRAEADLYGMIEEDTRREQGINPALLQRLLRRRPEYHDPKHSTKIERLPDGTLKIETSIARGFPELDEG